MEDSAREDDGGTGEHIWKLMTLTDLVLLQGEKLVTRRATTNQLSSAIKGGKT